MHHQLPPRVVPDAQRLAQLGLLVQQRALAATVQVGLAQCGSEVLNEAIGPVGDPDHVVALAAAAGARAERGGELGGERPA